MFLENYNSISALFGEKFISQKCEKNTKIEWPKGFGVYVVWEINQSIEKLIYVGMTGKFKKTETGGYTINSGNFQIERIGGRHTFFKNQLKMGFYLNMAPSIAIARFNLTIDLKQMHILPISVTIVYVSIFSYSRLMLMVIWVIRHHY